MRYFYLLRWGLVLVSSSFLVACGQKPSPAEPLPTADAPLDNQLAGTRLQVERFASQHDALGHYYDQQSGSFVVVFPAGVPILSHDQMATNLQQHVRVQRVDMTRAIYGVIESEVAHLHSQHRGSTFAIYLDLPTGRAVLTSDLPRGVLEPLLRKYPALIEFTAGSIRTDAAKQ